MKTGFKLIQTEKKNYIICSQSDLIIWIIMESKTNTKLNSMTSKQVTKLTIFFEKLLKENYKTDRQLKRS